MTQAAGAASAAAPTGTPAGAAPAAPLGPAPTPSPAAPVAQPGAGAGGPGGPGVAPMSTNQQQNAAAAAPIPVTAARAERDAMAAAARAGLVRKSAGDADVQFAERIAAALHAPPSIPAMAWNFVWAVGVTTDGEIIAANSYGVSFIPDGMCLPSQVIFVSADERIPAGQRGRWVREPFVALQAWCTFHEKTLKVIIGTEQEVQPFAGSLQTRVIPPEDIPTDGLMKGRTRLEVIAPEAAAKLAEWPDAQLHEALPPQPVQLVPPDPAAIGKAWMESIRPLMQTTGETYRTAHLEKLAAYGRLQESAALYRAYTAPYAADLRAAITDWVWWQQFSTIQGDAQLVELGA
ncbi:secretion protein EccK [Mycobacterium sp. SMC-21]|uniref:secretion protein EccK n=1 Tax=Mycobacteriaceae TaxID=1762 RepID=UPI001042174E|nr:secretion protein EccK [Mycolicibacterium mucogenicum]TXH20791.1 MAG: secretion protein EccK [Mycobacterium sp.]